MPKLVSTAVENPWGRSRTKTLTCSWFSAAKLASNVLLNHKDVRIVETAKTLTGCNGLTSAQTAGDYDFAVNPSPLHAPPAHESSQRTHGYTSPA
jgi:hypothetical protein